MACLQLWQKIFINNQFINAVSGKFFPTTNPSTGFQIAAVAEGDAEDVDLAVSAARAAFDRKSVWRGLNASKRGHLLHKLADLIEKNSHLIASIETVDNGNPYLESICNVKDSVNVIRYFAGWCDKIHGTTIPADGSVLAMTRREPVGVVGQIIHWNFPLLLLCWKMAPALAAGCTVVIKPAELTPLTALMVAALSKEAGFPPGVLNVVPGYGSTAGAAIASHIDIDKVAFTGSRWAGRSVLEAAAKSNMKRVTMELGGKSPLVVFDDYDLDKAVHIAHKAAFDNQGQVCSAGSRTFVHKNIYDEFVKRSVEKAEKRIVGDPYCPHTEQGPQIDNLHLEKILEYVESGIAEGAKLETGGKRKETEGYFMEATVFSHVKDNMKIAREQFFGPVQTILKFSSLDEIIERSNILPFALASGILTNDINKAMLYAQAVEAGTVWVNCYNRFLPQTPFGGYKLSGIGRYLGEKALDAYMELKTITIETADKN